MRILQIPGYLLVVFAMGCAPAVPPLSILPTPRFATATVAATARASATATAAAPTPTNTPTVVNGTTSTQLNVRAEPQAAAAPLGMIPAAATVQVIGKAPGENWYEILFEGGNGWVASQYVAVADKGRVPLANRDGSTPMASVREQIFVRTGPGTAFETLGTQSARDVVRLAGKNAAGNWIQIEFAGAPGGRAWVAASFLEGAQPDVLPIVSEAGDVVGTPTPTGTAAAPTPTIAAAMEDGDSAQNPMVDVRFSPSGTGSLLYEGEVSAPEGDQYDWVRFKLYRRDLLVRFECSGNSTLALQLQREGQDVPTTEPLACGHEVLMKLEPGDLPYSLRIAAIPVEGRLVVVRYSLRIANSP